MTTVPGHRPAHSIASSVRTKSQQQSLARRLLLHPHSNEDLPPLFSSPNLPPELTAEVYDFIAMALRAYVNPWWTKITRYDKEFLPHINRIIVHVVGVLESRINKVDLPPLVFHDLPALITQHYVDFRNAQSKLSTSYANGGDSSLSELFAHLQPHMAVSSDGKIDPEYYRQTFDQILKLCLPPEDSEPEVERTIVREVLVKVIVDGIVPKVTQPWFIQRTILDLIGGREDFTTPQPVQLNSTTDSSFFHALVVIILSALQSFSGACLALMQGYKQTISTIKLVNQSPSHPSGPIPASIPSDPVQSEPVSNAAATKPAPSVSSIRSISVASTTTVTSEKHSTELLETTSTQLQDYATPPLTMLAEIVRAQDRYSSSSLLIFLSMLSSSLTPFLDKLLPYMLTQFLSPSFIVNMTRLSKRTMFPNGYLGPPPIEPTPEEQAQIRAKLLAWRGTGAISHLLPVILGSDPSATLSGALDPLGDARCNVRLFVFLLDRLLVALFPELVR